MNAWRLRAFGENNFSWAGILLTLLTISLPSPVHCRPVNSAPGSTSLGLDESSPHRDEPLFFDSQRDPEDFRSKPMNNSGMIVRVIVTSSSSSSSSDSEDADFSTFHDFQFPQQSFQTQAPTSTTTVKPKTYYTEKSRKVKTPDSDAPIQREDVEDIFSAFYRAFSETSSGFAVRNAPASNPQNTEGFQVLPQSLPNSRKNTRSEVRNRNDRVSKGKTTTERFEDEEAAADNSSANTAVVSSSSVGVSQRTSSESVGVVAPKSRKVSLSTSSSSSISVVGRSGPIASRNRSRVVNSEFFNRRSKVQTTRSTDSPSVSRGWENRNRRKGQRQGVVGSTTVSHSPEAQQLVQELTSKPTSTTTKKVKEITTTPSSTSWQQPEKVWSEPAKVWSLPARVWGEPEKVWSEPEKNWGQPERNWGQAEKVWGQQEQSWDRPQRKPEDKNPQLQQRNVPTKPPVNTNLNSRRSIYELKSPKSHDKTDQAVDVDKEPFPSQEDEDYQRDSEQPNGDESTQGTFVILGDDENEQDSIDGEFDRHLVLPVSKSTSTTTPKPSHTPYAPSDSKNSNNPNRSSYQTHRNSTTISTDSLNLSNTDTNSSNSQLVNNSSKKGKKFGYVLEGSNVRRYRVEERTPDGFIVGEYGVLNNQNAFLRGVRYTADGTINPRLIHEALMKFLSLRRR